MPKQELGNSIASYGASTTKQDADEGGTFASHLYQANDCLDLLKVARQAKKMMAFYQTSDHLDESSQAIASTRNVLNHEPEQARIIGKLCNTARTARNHLEMAYHLLAQLPDATKRHQWADRFLDLAKQFEPETRMLPQSEVSDKSIWSDIQTLVTQCEALQYPQR